MENRDNKKELVLIFSSFIIVLIIACVLTSIFVLGSLSFWDSVDNWSQEQEPWEEIQVNIAGYDGDVFFLAQVAHPFLAEYNYKIKVEHDGESEVFQLPTKTGGQISESIYIINQEGTQYLEICGVLINLINLTPVPKNIEKENDSYSDTVIGNISYNEIRIFGKRQYFGTIKKRENDLVIESEMGNEYSNEDIIFSNWTGLPGNVGRVRFGSEAIGNNYIIGYIEMENLGGDSSLFEIDISRSKEKTIYFIPYKDKFFISLDEGASESFNIDNLVSIGYGSMSVFTEVNGNEIKSFGNPFISELYENATWQKLLRIEFGSDGVSVQEY